MWKCGAGGVGVGRKWSGVVVKWEKSAAEWGRAVWNQYGAQNILYARKCKIGVDRMLCCITSGNTTIPPPATK